MKRTMLLFLVFCGWIWGQNAAEIDRLNRLSAQKYNQGKYREGEILAAKTYKLTRKVLGEKHPSTINSMNNLGLLYQAQGIYDKAEFFHVKAFALNKEVRGEKHIGTMTSMNNLGLLYQAQGRYDKAEPLFIKTVRLNKEVLGEKHPQTINSMNNLGQLYQAQGRYDKVEPLYTKVLRLNKEVLGEKHLHTIYSMGNLAVLYQTQGRYDKAEPLLSKTVTLSKEVLGEKHPHTIYSMGNLGVLYQDQGRYDKAEPLYTKVLRLNKEVLGEKHPQTINSISYLGYLYRAQGRYDKAEPLFAKTVTLNKKVLGEKHPDTITSMVSLSVSYQLQGKYEKAEPLLAKTVTLSKKVLGKKHPNTITSINNLGISYYTQGRNDKASEIFTDSLTSLHYHLSDIIPYKDKNTQLSFLNTYKYAIKYINAFKRSPKYKPQILKLSYLFKGNIISLSQNFHQKFQNVQQQEKYNQYISQKRKFANLLLSNDIKKEKINKLENKIENLEVELSQFMEIKKRNINLEMIQKKLKKNEYIIDFIKYENWETEKPALVACIVGKDSFECVFWDEWEPLEKKIKECIEQLANRGNTNNIKLIYNKLWQPLEKHLKGTKKIYLIPDSMLYLFPFKALTDNENNSLMGKYNIVQLNSLHNLFQEVDTTNANNDITIFADPDYGKGKGILQFKRLSATKAEANTIIDIANKNKMEVTLFKQQHATKSNFEKLNENSPRILHLATHGYFLQVEKYNSPHNENIRGVGFGNYYNDSDTAQKKQKIAQQKQNFSIQQIKQPKQNPYVIPNIERYEPLYNCGLVFANANSNNEENIIRAIDIQNINLVQTKLVVLSACETATGEDKNVAGIYSLQRAFHTAGVPCVLATLWSINDNATMLFMEKFYGYFLNKAPPQEALRQTQLEFIQSEEYNHPYYWAAFVMVGDDKHFPEHTKRIDFSKMKVQRSGSGFIINILIALFLLILVIVIAVIVCRKIQYNKQQKQQRAELRRTKRMRK